jgi:transforming growth factor-beta-induced protein
MFSAVALALCLSFACPSHQASLPSFTDILSSQKNLSSFSDVLNKSYPDLLTRIGNQSSQNITILAPSNAAFAKTVYYPIIGPAFSNNDIGAIRAILDYHVVIGDHPSTSLLPTFQYFPTWLSNTSFTNVTGGQRVGGVMQSGTDMIWTSGQSSRSPAIVTDIAFEGGTVHIIDSLVTPPSSFPATAEVFSTAAEPFQLTSFLGATYFSRNGTTSTIATLLNETSDITIFAPNNVAMESVALSLTSMSMSNTSAAFQELLKYHIIVAKGGPWYSTSFPENGTVLETLNGDTITVSFSSNSFFINSARVLTSDLLIANGVMHVLDNVLSPDNPSTHPNPSLGTQIPVLSTGGSFNVSAAPFTTFLPDAIITHSATSVATGTHGGGSQTTATTDSTASTSTAKSGGMRTVLNDGFWTMMCSLMMIVI